MFPQIFCEDNVEANKKEEKTLTHRYAKNRITRMKVPGRKQISNDLCSCQQAVGQ